MRNLAILFLCTCLGFCTMGTARAVEKNDKDVVVRIAVANMERITTDLDYEKVRLLSIDKETRDAMRQINQELKQARTELLALTDELKLMDYQKKMEFLNKKKSLIQERNYNRDNSKDIRKLARDFIIEHYKDKYVLIISEANTLERSALYKAVVIEDITDEAGTKFRAYINELAGE